MDVDTDELIRLAVEAAFTAREDDGPRYAIVATRADAKCRSEPVRSPAKDFGVFAARREDRACDDCFRSHVHRPRRRSSKNAFVNGTDGSFASVRMTGNHVTIAVEGRDQDGPSVAGMSLSIDGVDRLLARLTNVRVALARRLAKPLDITRAPTQDGCMSNQH